MKNTSVVLAAFIAVLTLSTLGTGTQAGNYYTPYTTAETPFPHDALVFPAAGPDLITFLYILDNPKARNNGSDTSANPQYVVGTASGVFVFNAKMEILSVIKEKALDLGVEGGRIFMETSTSDGTSRVLVYTLNGTKTTEFALGKGAIMGSGIGVNYGRGEIYHSNARGDGGLISVYNPNGQFMRSFGTPMAAEDGWPWQTRPASEWTATETLS